MNIKSHGKDDIISKETRLDIEVVTELHEWLPDLTFSYDDDIVVVKAALQPYLMYDKIIVVCHGVVMRQFEFTENLAYCSVLEVEMDENFQWCGFVEH